LITPSRDPRSTAEQNISRHGVDAQRFHMRFDAVGAFDGGRMAGDSQLSIAAIWLTGKSSSKSVAAFHRGLYGKRDGDL